MEAIQFIADMNFYHWLTLAAVLLIAEIALPGGFFLGAAAGALFTGLIHILMPEMSWQLALTIYSVSAVAFSFLAVTKMRGVLDFQSDHETLNNRMDNLLGAHGVVLMPAGGAAKVKIGDTLWGIVPDEKLYDQAEVKVVAVDGTNTVCELLPR
ncbi:NfeD family protein [uncultured Pseudoteredinibacter sp.]|uniref:NfeD family protein n=1 Tax=uncultured Pseudoteredinibacter sp. TaxID=1641701 RepID=UPI0026186DDC|nr:NfeD family protein [uncultured Pseudoteredinibacter sp.]